ncbi:hypothetical protein [Psychrobacillus sp. FSL H8-0510]|uniref:hypothetical protein n=1 Tax=Psychrobacillus sp. FSL H8-0510 TaxID=2921394 RepID=UPI0030FB2D29
MKNIKQIVLLGLMVIAVTYNYTIVSAESNVKTSENTVNIDGEDTISQGLRWPNSEDGKEWITIKMADGGIRVVDKNDQTEFLVIDSFGGIYLNGDVYIKGQAFESYIQGGTEGSKMFEKDNVILIFVSMILIFLSILILLIYMYKNNLDKLDKKIELLKN